MLVVSQAYLVPAGCSRPLFTTLRYKLEWPGEPSFDSVPPVYLIFIISTAWIYRATPGFHGAFLGFVGFLSNFKRSSFP